jgi:hypothetical protein
MQLVTPTALQMFSDVLVTRRPHAVTRRPRAPATSAPVGFSIHAAATRAPRAGTPEHEPQSTSTQRTGSPPADEIAPTSARHADGPRVPPSEIRDEPAVGNQPMCHPGAQAVAAQVRHFNSPRRNPYTQRIRPLAPLDTAPARHAAGPRAKPSAIPGEPPSETRPPTSPARRRSPPRSGISILPAATRTPRGPAHSLPSIPRRCAEPPACAWPRLPPAQARRRGPRHRPLHTPATRAQVSPAASARHNPHNQRPSTFPPGDTAYRPGRQAALTY